MTAVYTLDQHIDNINLINKLISKVAAIKYEQEGFSLINLLADFVSRNQQYNDMKSFLVLAEALVDAIEYCNSDEFSNNVFSKIFANISSNLSDLLEEINSLYKINLYFVGRDKYKLIDKILNSKVNLIFSREIIKSEKTFNILIVSEETYNEVLDIHEFEKVIYYDRFMNNSFSVMQKIYHQYYDYYYLLNSIEKAKEFKTEGIIVGLSYSLFGIDEHKLRENIVNLSLPSQDLYYSFKIAKDVIQKNNNIEKCIIGTSYYSLYWDMSKSKSDGFSRIQDVYYPIFKDSHNFNYIEKADKISLQRFADKYINFIFNVNEMGDQFAKLLFKSYGSYFNNTKTREACSLLKIKKLDSLNKNEKLSLARERVNTHNKLSTYRDTKNEYVSIMEEFLKYLCSKNVEPIVINFAATRYYNKFFNTEYIKEYKEVINKLSKVYEFDFVDLNDFNIFTEEDFVDFDHLNNTGASKVSAILRRLKKY